MIAQNKIEFDGRASLIDYLEQSAASLADAIPLRSEAEMEELAEQHGILYIPRTPDAVDERDDEEEWEEADLDYQVPPPADDRDDDAAEADSSPEYVPTSPDFVDAESSETPTDPMAELQTLVALAKYGDESAVARIGNLLDACPALWQSVGDLGEHSEQLLITIVADGNALVSESMQREIKRLKDELADDATPSPLERLTIQRIVASWLFCQYTDRATLAADAAGSKSASWGKRQEWAEKRYQLAIKSLDLVRRLKPRRKVASDATAYDENKSTIADSQVEQGAANGKSTAEADEHRLQGGRASEADARTPVNRIRRFVQDEEPVS